jgi:putative membrane protein insertion efficiency factor
MMPLSSLPGSSLPGAALRVLIRAYQLLLSPILPPSCRFAPSCSHYAYQAVGRFGALRGGWLAIHRIARCHPWSDGGYDPVPDAVPAEPPRRVLP